MPTTRMRHMITETDDVRNAIDAAARVWPELAGDRPALLRQLIQRGADEARRKLEAGVSERRRAIRETAGIFTGMYPAGEAARLKEEWPA